jgi:hypothetical protein
VRGVEQVRQELIHQQPVFRVVRAVNKLVVRLVIQAGALVAPSEVIGGGFDCADDAVGGGSGHWRESSGFIREVARERDTKVWIAVCLVNRAIENSS